MRCGVDKLAALERIADIAEKIVYDAISLQPDQFNPETYEVSAEYIDALVFALRELDDSEVQP